MHVSPIDLLLIALYGVFVLGIGFAVRRRISGSGDFLLAGRSIPAWVAGLAFLSANLGAQEMIGMAASGAKYGIMTSHFYWVGAVPAMLFVGVFMMPFYYGSRARSVPEYLKLRFDEKTRAFNALTFAVMTVFSSGISMYAMGALLSLLLGWNIHASIVISAIVVLVYISLGGLTSAIYNEVLQFFMIVFGFAPLVYLGLREVGGWEGLQARDSGDVRALVDAISDRPRPTRWASSGSACVMGLGFVLSFGYWCTDFLVVQRAMAADSMNAARRTPVIAALPKMIFPFLVIVPGIIALGLTLHPVNGTQPVLPLTAAGGYDYNMALPMMMARYYPEGMLGLGLTALMASFMSGMAGNVTAFNTVWTYDLYQSYLVPGRSDAHYLQRRPRDDHRRHAAQRGGGVPGDALQQHHGHAPADLQLRERAAVRDVPAGHVLEAHDRARRVLGPGRRARSPRAGHYEVTAVAGGGSLIPEARRRCTTTRRTWRRISGARSGPGRSASS